jgi:hypothetical protein
MVRDDPFRMMGMGEGSLVRCEYFTPKKIPIIGFEGEHSRLADRQFDMVRSRTSLYLLIVLVIFALGGLFHFYSFSNKEPTQNFPATVNRDCAPWDGVAFSVMVEIDSRTTLYISIWRSPDIKFPSTFVLPENEGQIGNAYILPELGPYTPLNGDVWFQRVDEGLPIEGRFRFTSERGERFEGRFVAEWGSQMAYCG